MRARLRSAPFALIVIAACDDAPGKAWLVDRSRVLGARIEALAEPERASIAPGERTRITWLVVGPVSPPRVAWSFAACVAPSGNFARPRCENAVLAAGTGASDGSELVTMAMTMPNADALGDAREMLVVSAFCEEPAPPALEPRDFTATCASGSAPLLASTLVRLAAAGPNRHPLVADDAVVVPTECVPPGGPEQEFVFRFRGAEREDGESILLSHVVTAGELDRQYDTFEASERAPKEIFVPWTPPREAGEVHVFFVLRDGRGGTTFIHRKVCVRRG